MLQLRLLGGFEVALDGSAQTGVTLAQPKREALLAYLALAEPRGFHRRDTLLALFWPEADGRHARRALNQALHHLRVSLDRELIVTCGDDGVGLDRARFRCDAVSVYDALAADRLEDALLWYRAELLPGFHVHASNEFDEWLEQQRWKLRESAAAAAGTLCERAQRGGDDAGAVHWARRACELAPLDESRARALLRLLRGGGNEAAARTEYERLADRLRRELDVEPSPETTACLTARRVAEARVIEPTRVTVEGARAALESVPANRPRRRSLLYAATAAITISAIGIFAALRAGPPASMGPLDARGGRPVVLIADMTGPQRDTTLGDVATQLFVSALQDSRSVRTVWSGELHDAVVRMQRSTSTAVRGGVARELAQREGFGGVLEGSVRDLGGELLLTVALVEPTSGRVWMSRAASVRDASGLTTAIDALARTLRRRIGDSADAIARAQPLAQVTTSSIEALRAYTTALRLMNAQRTRPIELLEHAVQLDTGFAAAYRSLGVMLSFDEQPERASEMLLAAVRHADRLTEADRDLAEAVLYSRGRYYDSDKAITALESMLERDSMRFTTLANLAWLLDERRQFARALPLAERVIQVRDSGAPAMFGTLSYVRWQLGDTTAARRTIDAGIRRFHHPESYLMRSWMHFVSGWLDSADADLFLAQQATKPSDAARNGGWILGTRAAIARRRGRLAEAHRIDAERVRAARALGNRRLECMVRLDRVTETLLIRRDTTRAVALLGEVRSLVDSVDLPDRPVFALADGYADAGRPELAAQLLRDRSRHIAPGEWTQYSPDEHQARAHIALAEGRAADAVRELRLGDFGHCVTCVLPMLSLAYERAGMPDSALAVGERYLTRPDPRSVSNGMDLPMLHRRLARLYSSRADTVAAERHLAAFVETWRGADRELRPQVDAARRELDGMRQRVHGNGPEARRPPE